MAESPSDDDLLCSLKNEAQHLYVLLKTIDSFCGTTGKINLINSIAPDFFVIVRDSLVDNVILSLTRLTDNQNKRYPSVTIQRLVDAMPSTPKLDSVRKKIKSLKTTCEAIRKHRNKRVAHSDEVYAIRLEELPEVVAEEFARASALVQEIINGIEKQLGKDPTGFDEIWIKTGGNLLLKKLVWARRWEQQESSKHVGSQLVVTDSDIETTDWLTDLEGKE